MLVSGRLTASADQLMSTLSTLRITTTLFRSSISASAIPVITVFGGTMLSALVCHATDCVNSKQRLQVEQYRSTSPIVPVCEVTYFGD